MSDFWSWFIVVGTVGSLVGMLWLLFGNRKTSGEPTTGHEWDGIQELDQPLPQWWAGMFVGSIVLAVLLLVAYPGLGSFDGALAWTSVQEHDGRRLAQAERFAPLYAELAALSPEAANADLRTQQVGRRLFINHCSTCHGVNASGGFGFPNLTDADWIWGGDLARIEESIRGGRHAQMPPWGPALGDSGVDAVSHYVAGLAGGTHDPVRAEQGAAQYETFCVSCHGSNGTGDQLLGAPNLADDVWLYGGSIPEIAFTVRHGRSGQMPPHDGLLDDARIRILANYVRGLSQ